MNRSAPSSWEQNNKEMPMRKIKIPKKKGSFREIYIPDNTERLALQQVLGNINRKALRLCGSFVHGFIQGRSAVTNAQEHVGHEYTVCMDLKDFFDSVKEIHLKGILKEEEISKVFIDGAPRQGLPTSPAVANLAAISLDKAIIKWRDKNKLNFIFTRYADDLSFSFDDPTLIEKIKEKIPQIVSQCGFKINKDKTQIQSAKSGRRIITGVAVDENGIHPTRAAKRKLRAARHQHHTKSSRGLAEWCKLKTPQPKKQKEKTYDTDQLKALMKLWKLNYKINEIPEKLHEDFGDFIITGDFAYTLGCSTYTTGWKSCLSQPNGQYKKTVISWLLLKGTRIAALLSNKTQTFAGIERRSMRARSLVHTLRNGIQVFDRIYGNTQDQKELEQKLRSKGIISIHEAKSKFPEEKVVGNIPAKLSGYCDNLKCKILTHKGKKVKVFHI